MLLYHGSNQDIVTVNLNRCKPYKDFGRGFYLTAIKEQAKLMAKRTARIFGGFPVVTAFVFDETALSERNLSVKIFAKPTAEWAIFVLNNRNRDFMDYSDLNSNQDNKYDIVTGPVANDDIALLFRTFASGYIDIDTLVRGMRYKKLSNQYSFHTNRSIAYLSKAEVGSCE
ncbi:MAG: DUF3990 domain-containing protein [Oscillospiraceae bacterium]|nr:DUF3990 domain-containing protein [Oscillospiraceae bacterium]